MEVRERVVSGGSRWRGLAYGLAVVLLFGLYTPVAKYWLHDISPLVSSGILYLSAGLTLALVQSVRWLAGRPTPRHQRLGRKDAPILSLGILCGCIASPLLLAGLGHVSGTVASLLANLEGVFTIAIALLLGDTLRRLEVAGAAAILAGGIVLSFNSQGGPGTEWIGIVAIAASCLAWAIDSTTTQKLSQRDPLDLMATKCLLAGPLSFGMALVAGHPMPPLEGAVAAAVIGAAGWAASMVCFALAMRHLGAAKVGGMLTLSPFAGAVGSILGLGEPITLAIVAAGAMMALGAYLLAHGHLSHSAAPAGPIPTPAIESPPA